MVHEPVTDPEIDGAPAPPAAPGAQDTFTVHYQLAPADLRIAGFVASRYSVGGNALGAFVLISGAIGFLLSGDVLSVVIAVFGLLLLSGVLPGLLVAFMAGRRPELMQQPTAMTIGASGIQTVTALTSGEAAWATYKRVRPTGATLLFELGTGATMLVPARAFTPEQLERLLAFADAAGVLDTSSPLAAYAKGIAIGAAFAVAVPALTWLGFAMGILS
jgi:hypothetical protein